MEDVKQAHDVWRQLFVSSVKPEVCSSPRSQKQHSYFNLNLTN